jgi:16S rRNA (uracil1498-N3)-methyltransferase
MHRFFIPPESWNLDNLLLDAAQAHHALDVVRLEKGGRAVVFNGQGAEATVEITSMDKRGARLRKIQHSKSAPLPCAITLGQAIPKGKNMDLIVQKATELGVAAIAPILSERTVIQYDADDAEKKQSKWQLVAIEAAKQCGQNWLPAIHRPQTLRGFFNSRHAFDLMLVASLQPGAMHVKRVLAEHEAQHKRLPAAVLVLVGPEGDFTPAEISAAISHGCRPITLGPIILRTETAAIYCLSVLSHELLNPVAH